MLVLAAAAADGTWQGISIDLWRRVATEMRASYRFSESATVEELLDSVANGKVDVAVAYATTLVLFVQATKQTTSANAIFLQSTAPIYVLLVSPFLLREPIRRADVWFLVALALGLPQSSRGTKNRARPRRIR
jgi:ABC-type amino acid transport substrate-binding protein